jgi:hypothetical protein
VDKQTYIYLIKNLLAPIDKTNRYHPAQIEAVCDIVYAELMAAADDDILGDLDAYSKEYTSVTVSEDATRGLKYSTLPAAICPIPGVTSGVRKINVNSGLDLDVVPTTELEMYYADGSAARMTDTTIGYWLQGTKVWYDESMTDDIISEGVRMILLPRFSAYADTDTVLIPGCTDTQFCQKVLQFLAPTVPVDLKANNS